MQENAQLSVTAKIKILKYAEGTAPENSDPFEVIEKEIVLFGEDAKQAIKQFGGDV